MQAGDIVVKLTLRSLDEVEAFSAFLSRFLDGALEAVDRLVGPTAAPFVMVSSEPFGDAALRTVTFREPALAAAFSRAWEKTCGGGRAMVRL